MVLMLERYASHSVTRVDDDDDDDDDDEQSDNDDDINDDNDVDNVVCS